MKFYGINVGQFMIFRHYAIYNKHEMIKTGNQTRGKSRVLSQTRIIFAVDCTNEQYSAV